jgi:hypothetical protein
MSSFVTGGAARASEPKTETEAPKQLFVRMNGPTGQLLPPLQVLRTFFNRFGRVVKITPAKNGTIAFVTFQTAEEAKAALDAMNGSEVVDESNGASLVRTLFVDFAVERGSKPVHVQRSRPAPAPRPAPVEAPRPAPVEAPRPAPVEAPRQILPRFDPSSLSHINDSILPGVMKWLGQETCMQLLNIGRNPAPKVQYQNMSYLQLFSDGSLLVWYIPHPNHPYALTECLEGLDSGRFTHMTSVQIPSEVLKMSNCWRC